MFFSLLSTPTDFVIRLDIRLYTVHVGLLDVIY